MSEHEMDVVVIGLGPGGEDAAGQLAEAGLRVAGVEARLVGGECPYWGCVPSKMMIRAADLLAEGRRIPGMAGASAGAARLGAGREADQGEATDNWDDTAAADRFTGLGGGLFRGHATITAPGRVAVGDDRLTATRGIVIATGTTPAIPPVPGLASTPYWTNHQIIETEQMPESLIVLGGGAIGVGAGPGLLPLRGPGHGGRGRRPAAAARRAGGRGAAREGVRPGGHRRADRRDRLPRGP